MAHPAHHDHGPLHPRVWFALITVYIIWGTTYLAIDQVNESLPPLMAAGVRFFTAGTIMFVFTVRRGDRAGDRPGRAQWIAATIVGGSLLLTGNGLVVLAEITVPTGIVSLVIALVPIWMALIDAVLLRRRPRPAVVLGLVGGFAGAALLVGTSAGVASPLSGLLMSVGASLSWAAGSLYSRTAPLPDRPFVGVGMEMMAGGALLVLAGILRGELAGFDPGAVTSDSILGFLYLVAFGSFAGYASYVWLLRNAPTSLVSTYAYVNPLVAVFLGWAVLGEAITGRTLLAGAIVLGSVALIIASRAERPTPDLTSGAEPIEEGWAEDGTEV